VELGRVTIAIGDPTVEPADQVGRAIAATADIWREHALVMCAAVELSATVPEIDRRWTATVHETAEAAVDLIVSLDVIPEARDEDAARRLVRALVWATERNFYNVMRAGGDDAELSALVHDLTVIWRRALGLVER
jgi:hypothetical protein